MCYMTFTVKVIACFFDIDGIDDHFCLNFLFCVQSLKMRGDQRQSFLLLIFVKLFTITVKTFFS